jgi:hypothetical protein
LVPSGGYRDLNVKDGDHAAAEYKRMISVATTATEKERIANDLLAYCERDTLAMLEVFQALRDLSRHPSSPLKV